MSENRDEQQQIYLIPWNYDETGGVLGGKVTTRNAVELFVLCAPLALLEYKLLHFSWQTNLTIAMITLIPLAAFTLLGFGRESISQRVLALYRFKKRQRKLSYFSFSDYQDIDSKQPSIDRFLDDISTIGLTNAVKALFTGREPVDKPKAKKAKENSCLAKKARLRGCEDSTEKSQVKSDNAPVKFARGKKKPDASTNKWMNSAMREMLLKKLELGDEDDFEV